MKPQTAQQINTPLVGIGTYRKLPETAEQILIKRVAVLVAERDKLKAALKEGIAIAEETKILKEGDCELKGTKPEWSINYCELSRWVEEAKKLL